MTTTVQQIGYLKLMPEQTLVEEEFIKANLVNNNYGIDELFQQSLVTRFSDYRDYDITKYEETFWRELQMLVHITMRWLEHENKLAPTILSFVMAKEHLDYRIVCKAYQ